jgi:hypothetical protein
MIIKKFVGAAGMALVALCAVAASARSDTAIEGKAWYRTDDSCFTSYNYGVVGNSCPTTRTFRVGGHADSYGAKTVNMVGNGNGNGSSPTTCLLIATDALGLTASIATVATTSGTSVYLTPQNQVISVPNNGQIYAHCDVAAGGGLASFHYTL